MRNKRAKIIMVLGCCCILAAAALYTHNSWLSARAANDAKELTDTLSQLIETSAAEATGESEASDPLLDLLPPETPGPSPSEPEPSPSDSPQVQTMMAYNISGYDVIGTISMPTVRINMAVIAEWSYPNLKVSCCRYYGSPDTQMVILGHNYEAHFGRLKDIQTGDSLTFTDVNDKVYSYTVTAVEEISGNDLNAIITGDWDLTLFTCTYSGTSRVVVRCDLVDDTAAEASPVNG